MALEEAEPALVRDAVTFRGHALVRSAHQTTIEVTTEEDLTENGDCIIGVGASKGCAGLDQRMKEMLRKEGAVVTVRLKVGTESFEFRARGDPRLTLSHPHDMVIRKSDFVSDRTLAVGADAAARDIPRGIVSLLRLPGASGVMELEVR